jgi:4-diphosphocytidyl-2-C-methyl-D-erythritol kinase
LSKLAREAAPAKLNLALHVRGKLSDGRHAIETVFAFCTDGDCLAASPGDEIRLEVEGPFATALGAAKDNLVMKAARSLANFAGSNKGAVIRLEKKLPVASGIGGGSADAAAALRLLTSMWNIDPAHAEAVAPGLGSDVPACLLSLSMRGEGAGDRLVPADLKHISGSPVLLVNPGVALSTAEVFSRWDGKDRGPLGEWHDGRNDLEEPAIALVPEIGSVLSWLSARPGANFVRMSGSGATCFALFDSEGERDTASDAVPSEWWRLPTYLR